MIGLIRQLLCQKLIKEHDQRTEMLVDELNNYSSILSGVGKVVFKDAGGIYKRIAENREILEQLDQGVRLCDKESNIYYLLSAHHQFLINLAVAIAKYAPNHKDNIERFKIDDIELFKSLAEKHDKVFQKELSVAASKVGV